jgi:lipoyl(octanoyl) transferase
MPGQDSAVDGLPVKWVARSGGCVVHGPGQLAVYSISPHHPTTPEARNFRTAMHQGVMSFLGEIGISIRRADPKLGIWSRLGAVAIYCNRESDELTYHGLYLNVHPLQGLPNQVQFLPPSDVPDGQIARMSSLLAEQRQPVRMTQVRAELLPAIAQALGCERYHIFTGHPLLSRVRVHDG